MAKHQYCNIGKFYSAYRKLDCASWIEEWATDIGKEHPETKMWKLLPQVTLALGERIMPRAREGKI